MTKRTGPKLLGGVLAEEAPTLQGTVGLLDRTSAPFVDSDSAGCPQAARDCALAEGVVAPTCQGAVGLLDRTRVARAGSASTDC